jgi:hypothetical protein
MTRAVILLATAFALTCSCVISSRAPGPVRSETKTVDLDKTEMTRVEIRMGAGEMQLSGGATRLFEGDFRYSESVGRPEVRYEATGFRGRLSVDSHSSSGLALGEVTNIWNLRLNESKPIDLQVNLGAGESTLDLTRLSLRSLEVRVGAGQLRLNLGGEYKHDFEGRIHGGVGEADITLPKTAGVSVDVKGGIGEVRAPGLSRNGDRYVNAAFGKAPVSIRLEVRGGIGQINLIGE